ncbi:serine protease persephone-like isoform X2 [Belonocnema kinseyi]|uniref:serine protease persephone-like isoform X2 n=1 Tax=Belonocnema kinseyi TaxID=2817044 RepID=UPI00143D445A|nr:serine protease persephone-like isoform X2 [Belonocnema kinseyi]
MDFRFQLCLQFLQLLTNCCVAEFAFQEEYYGNPCLLDKGQKGVCKNITQCPEKLKETKQGLRGPNPNDRCGFSGSMEVVCCPLQHIDGKVGLRSADVACHQFENEIPISEGLVFHILGGDETVEGEFPFMAALGYHDKDRKAVINYNCGGSLISTQYILTAAHCIINVNGQVPVEARMGSVNLEISNEAVQRILIAEKYPHPKYKMNAHYYDIALIKLRFPVKLTATVKPVCLLTKSVEIADTRNASLISAGFGATSFDTERSLKLMKTPSLSLVSRFACDNMYTNVRKLPHGIDDTMLCGRDANVTRRSDACQGDSGGPLLLRKENTQSLVGVTSFGSSCGSSVPGVYMSVYPFLDWIEAQVWGDEQVFVYPGQLTS